MSNPPELHDTLTTSDAGPSSLPSSPRPQSPNVDLTKPLRRQRSQTRFTKLIAPGRSRSSSNASLISINQEDTGGSSGRITPELRRRAGKAAASSLLASDAKYKKYALAVDKSLQAFESINEWADFISFLSRLLKTLQTPSPSYPEVPRKLIVSKRLAQCLNPALPAGVHQRALDVYAYIFSTIGTEGLKRDLLIWSSGLFPFFQHATTSVRPTLINIYETYYLPLGADIRPATKALVLALLPGMEEETGDFFERILSLLDKVSEAITPSFFLKNIFLILLSSPQSRLSALNFLSRRLLSPPEDTGQDVGLIIRGVSAVLTDENILVRRHGFDLLLRVLKLDESLFKEADRKDQEILIRAACGVVLQRELSLSRRVYTWFLGAGESPSDQIRYFNENGLEILASTLQNDMESLSSRTDLAEGQKPFKIFLSLLDKWEVGSALSERLAIPALQAIKNYSTTSKDVLPEEVIATGLAVYEAIEPMAIEMVQWLLTSIPQHDEEVNSIHVPILLATMLRVISSGTLTVNLSIRTYRLATSLLSLIDPTTFAKARFAMSEAYSDQKGIAEMLYDTNGEPRVVHERLNSELLPRIVTTSFEISEAALSRSQEEPENLSNAMSIVSMLIEKEAPTLAAIDVSTWLAKIVETLSHVSSFVIVEVLVTVALKASRCSAINPPVYITSDKTMSAILDAVSPIILLSALTFQLFRYLRPDAAPYHIRAVELLWEYNQLAEVYTLENVIARRLASIPFSSAAFDAFGIFWRLTDDSMLPGEIFNLPISLVLDALKSSDPDIQRQAETWMRLNLRSYFRVLDPIIGGLLDPAIRYQDDTYATPVDFSLIKYQLETVSVLFKFGGQGLSKACLSTEIKHSVHPTLIKRAETAFPSAVSYLEVMMLLLTRFIRAEGSPSMRKAAPLIVRVQSAALDLLQTIVSRGDVYHQQLNDLKTALVVKLSAAVRHRQLTLQSKMLHLLHSAITASTPHQPLNHRRTPSLNNEKAALALPPSEMDFEINLVKMIVEAVSSSENFPVLQHWIDFVLMTIPQISSSRSGLLQALSECFAQQLRYLTIHIDSVYARSTVSMGDERLRVTDAEVIMILNALERVLTVLSFGHETKPEMEGKHGENEKGLLGLMSGVFTVEPPPNLSSRTEYPRYLDDAIHALLVSWAITIPQSKTQIQSPTSSRDHTYENIRSRVRKVLEKTFKTQPLEVITSCVHVWATNSNEINDSAIFDCVDTLTPSAQRLVELVCESVSGKSARNSSDFRANPAYLAFLEAYIFRLEAPIAVQVWTTLFGFAKDVIGSLGSTSARSQLFPILKCLTALSLTVSRTSALEDRRLRRDLQDTYAKLLDLVVTNATRITEVGIWSRALHNMNEEDQEQTITIEEGLDQIYNFLTALTPNLRVLLTDADKVNAACSGIMLTIVTPALKKQKVEPNILRLLLEISRIPSATKTWRIQIGEVFNDPRFFKLKSSEEVRYWKALICSLMDSDKERFGDVLGKIVSASSANIFSNRDQEMLVKALNLRRLSFILLAADMNQHLVQLPAIQERLVEMLRSSQVSPRVHSEVYLCLRVLLCRISPQHLANFWPVILAELLRIFELTMDDPPEDGSESLQLVLAACKFLDLLLVIQSEDFQVHQWMFVTDTTDAVYPSEEHSPEAIMDSLSNILNEGQRERPVTIGTDDELLIISDQTETELRKPRLLRIKSLTSIYQLQPFFSRASIDTFEGVFEGNAVDWEAIESGLSEEIFDM
ncbi:uncharacterized protein IL334_002504 [Kwoniella shivajii]|uniref:Dopey N-terminal domain-containing protein n=1 Tax=Kwoniella shivajii TaxID=564305 RepID=A0ABZ1CUX8_9TREE|nr:hypothetical protein IL334_002504 [Kwoniella shivajii]